MCVTVQEAAGKWERGVENQLDRTRSDYHNVQISDNRYSEKVFENVATEIASQFSHTRCEDQRFDLGIISIDNDEVISSSRVPIPRELGCIQEYQLRGAHDVARHNAETDRGTITRDPKCIYMIKQSSGRQQRYMSTQIQSCVWERCMIIQKRMKCKSQIRDFQQSNKYAELS